MYGPPDASIIATEFSFERPDIFSTVSTPRYLFCGLEAVMHDHSESNRQPGSGEAAHGMTSNLKGQRIMIRDMFDDYSIIHSGYWHLEVDLARPRIVSLRGDARGLGYYSPEMLEPGFGGETIVETDSEVFRSRDSKTHSATADEQMLGIKGISLGRNGTVHWSITLVGEQEEVLQITVERELPVALPCITDLPFAFQGTRHFAFWSRPSRRIDHDPATGYVVGYAHDRAGRRVIGWHSTTEIPEFVIHGAPSFPDMAMRCENGCHHLEMQYARHVVFGISSQPGADEGRTTAGRQVFQLELRLIPQGSLAPVAFESPHRDLTRFVPEFFDEFLLSAIACDHEYFGNNPYRHAYAPGAVHFVTRGYLATDRQSWSDTQGDIDARWKHHIRRTLAEGMVAEDRPAILMDSGVWQDTCGRHDHTYGSHAMNALFATACCHVLLKTGDIQFAREIFPTLAAILSSVSTLDADGDGLLESPLPGTPGSPSSSYNDNLSTGHKDGYLNAVAYEAFDLFASLAEWLGETESAARFRSTAATVAKAYNEQLWDERGGHYVGWIDVNGVRHDAWYTFTNFHAAVAGLVPKQRMMQMLDAFLRHPGHHRIFAAGVNLDPVDDGTYHGKQQFGLWLNGGVLLGPAAFELFARAVGKGGDCAWSMLRDVLRQWQKDHLMRIPVRDKCRVTPPPPDRRLRFTGGNAYTWIDGQGATGAGTESYLADGGALLWALYSGVYGIRPDFQGIAFEPHIPAELGNSEIGLRLMGRRLNIRFLGWGDMLSKLAVNGCDQAGRQLRWDNLPGDADVDVHLRPTEACE